MLGPKSNGKSIWGKEAEIDISKWCNDLPTVKTNAGHHNLTNFGETEVTCQKVVATIKANTLMNSIRFENLNLQHIEDLPEATLQSNKQLSPSWIFLLSFYILLFS